MDTRDGTREGGVTAEGSTVLTCRAPHPRGLSGDPRYAGKPHGVRLQVVPFAARPTYREINRWSDVHPGCLVVKCLKCGGLSEYALVSLPAALPGPRGSSSLGEPDPRPIGSRETPGAVTSDRTGAWEGVATI